MYKLLLVEDEYIERQAMKHVISQRLEGKYEVKEAINGIEGIELARSYQPDVIFLDIKMPGCSGMEAAREIRSFLPHVPMIFITAYDYFDYAKEAISLGVDEFLLKPVDIDEVCQYLEKVYSQLEETQNQQDHRMKMREDFTAIRKTLEIEFHEVLMKEDTKPEVVAHYLKLLDIQMEQSVIGLIDFTSLEDYASINALQKGVIKERFMSKLMLKCEGESLVLLTGHLKDLMTLVVIETVTDDQERRCKDFLQEVISQTLEEMRLEIHYQISLPIIEAYELPRVIGKEKKRLFTSGYKERKVYPFELEDQLVESVRQKAFDEALVMMAEIVQYLEEEYEFGEFRKELLGMYTLIERTLRRISPELILGHADKWVHGIESYEDLLHFYEHLFSYAKEVLEQVPDKNQMLIQKVCHYLESHYNETISLEEAASMIGFSSFYFTKLMKEHTQMSYIDYVTSIRVAKAKQLLESTDMTVKDVGIAVGYDNANYFTRVFKRIVGCAPSQYKI